MRLRFVPLVALATLALATPALSKVPVTRLSIAGGGLAEAVDVTDAEALKLSNPWHGGMADWSAEAAPPGGGHPVYEITLHARLGGPEARPIYRLRYVEGDGKAPGLVYLPGPGEPGYRENVRVIYRDGHDGHWHPATPAWDAAIRRALGRR